MKRSCALITGAARRIGHALALYLAGQGYDIALHYHRSAGEARSLQQEIRGLGVECRLFRANFSRHNSWRGLVARVSKIFPSLDLLINNASLFERISFQESTAADYDRLFDVNLKVPFMLSRDMARFCRKGMIINFLDSRIRKGDATHFIYSLTKKALAEMTILAAGELSPRIRVNGIAPGSLLPPVEKLRKGGRVRHSRPKGSPADAVKALAWFLKNKKVTGRIRFIGV